MSASLAELTRIVTDALANDTDLDEFVNGRISNTHFTDVDAGSVDFPLVVVNCTAGAAIYTGAVQTVVGEIWAWSQGNQGRATEVYDAIFDVLQAERLKIDELDRVVVCREVDRPNQGYNDVFRAWFTMGRWIFKSSG